MKQQYKKYIKLNKNILLGFTAPLVSQSVYNTTCLTTVNLYVKFMRLYKNVT
jgi:hypothetical protein